MRHNFPRFDLTAFGLVGQQEWRATYPERLVTLRRRLNTAPIRLELHNRLATSPPSIFFGNGYTQSAVEPARESR
jgi:hypothetical protein